MPDRPVEPSPDPVTARPLPVAAVQLEVLEGASQESRVERAVAGVEEAAASGARLVVLPELWKTGFFAFDDWAAAAEPLDGPTARALAGAAHDAGVWLIGGSLLERSGAALHNTVPVWAPDGRLAAAYRKIHLFPHGSREAEILEPGSAVAVVDVDGTRIGLATCYDLRFPELFRRLVDEGAEAFVVPAAWPAERERVWSTLLAARAIESQAAVLGCGTAGEQAGVIYAGRSVLFDAIGVCVTRLDDRPGLLRAAIDPEAIRVARREFPVLASRRLG